MIIDNIGDVFFGERGGSFLSKIAYDHSMDSCDYCWGCGTN